jgi:hypothetical protein
MKTRDIHRQEPRHDTLKSHLIAEERHDPYKSRGKPADGTVCPDCGAAFMEGRWQWAGRQLKETHSEPCPACRRIRDRYPAGEVVMSGGFLAAHRQEILRLVGNVAEAEKREHPMQRIIAIDDTAKDKVVITTTDLHLPRRIGHALVDAYKGELETHYDEAGYFVRIVWKRET